MMVALPSINCTRSCCSHEHVFVNRGYRHVHGAYFRRIKDGPLGKVDDRDVLRSLFYDCVQTDYLL
jgi:hypothetical protein